MKLSRLTVALLLPVFAGCASHAPAPVIERGAPAAVPVAPASGAAPAAASAGPGYYTVKKGDTLYGIALDNGQDYKDIAAWNGLENPNLIKIGQQLRVVPPNGASDGAAPVAVAKPVSASAPVTLVTPTNGGNAGSGNSDTLKRSPKGGKVAYSDAALAAARQGDAATVAKAEAKPETRAEVRPEVRPEIKSEAKPDAKAAAPAPTAAPAPAEAKPAVAGDEVDWAWPAGGKVIVPFAEGSSKGVDIAGKTGEPVLAAASGVVSYAGAGLRGYGNLVVLRHNSSYLSVYAHNSKILVKEKQSVSKGQKIAEMGSTDTESPRLHFEIRRQGKPADPLKFLPAR